MPTGDDRFLHLFLPLIVSPGRKQTFTLQVCTGIFSLLLRKATFSSLLMVKYLQLSSPVPQSGTSICLSGKVKEVSEHKTEWGETGT